MNNRPDMLQRLERSGRSQRGAAALEALLIITFFLIPLWMLMFVGGYFGLRNQQVQMATSLAAYEVVEVVGKGDSPNVSQMADSIGDQVFPGNRDTLKSIVDNPDPSSAPDAGDVQDDVPGSVDSGLFNSIMGTLSGHRSVTLTVARRSPYNLFDDTDVKLRRTVGGTPYVYCEQQGDLTQLGLSGSSAVMDVATVLLSVSNIILAPFGGLPTGSDKC